jgi:hypothetical protein
MHFVIEKLNVVALDIAKNDGNLAIDKFLRSVDSTIVCYTLDMRGDPYFSFG